MAGADEFLAALAAGDFRKLRRISEIQEPHLPKLSDQQAEQVMHDARTRTKKLPLKTRLWSHRWLTERGLESGLPEYLRPKAERVEPIPAYAVGIALGSSNPLIRAAFPLIRPQMENCILEAQADGKLLDADHVRARLLETKHRTMKELFGRLTMGGQNG